MSEQPKREGAGEKTTRWVRNIHYLGAIGLGGAALLFPGASVPLVVFGAWEAAHGAAWGAVHSRVKSNKRKEA